MHYTWNQINLQLEGIKQDFGSLLPPEKHTLFCAVPNRIADNCCIAEDFRSLASIHQRTSS